MYLQAMQTHVNGGKKSPETESKKKSPDGTD